MDFNKSTSYRHLQKLLKVGIIKKKVFHGTNSGYEIHFNTNLLVAEQNSSFNELLISNAKRIVKNLDFDSEIKIKQIKPPLNIFKEFYVSVDIIADCNHIVTRTILEHNINVVFVNSVNNYPLVDINLLEHQKSKGSDHSGVPSDMVAKPVLSEDLAPGAETVGNSVHNPLLSLKTLKAYVDNFYDIASNALWKEKKYEEQEHHTAKKYIELYITKGAQSVTTGMLFHRKVNFIARIQLTKNYIDRSPGRFVVNPALYFNPEFPYGFVGTKNWLEKLNAKKAAGEAYSRQSKILVEAWTAYHKNPKTSTYEKYRQKIGKMKEPVLLKLFNQGILSPEMNTHEGMKKIRNDHYGLHN
jgi:hypothetical protein